MKTILFYISGHGYGHSTRMMEIINHLIERQPYAFCHIKTYAPEWLYRLNLKNNYAYHHFVCDVGTVQGNSYHLNQLQTLRDYEAFVKKKKGQIETEVNFIRQANISLVVGDIPSLAFDIAAAAGVPSVAVGNFSWDWIYEPFVKEYPQYTYLVDEIKSAYAQADLLLRLPFHGDMSAFAKIEDIPLVGRKARLPRERVRKNLGLNLHPEEKLVLVALRANDLESVDWQNVNAIVGCRFLTFYPVTNGGNVLQLPPDYLPFEELVNASDAVISKPGYGIVSECIVNRTPLLYTPRFDFAEYDILAKALQTYGVVRFIPLDEFWAGQWEKYLQTLFEAAPQWRPIATHGAEVAAQRILEMTS